MSTLCWRVIWAFEGLTRHVFVPRRAQLMDTGLKRSEVGEIASKIGQLYYNYYLRTGAANLQERTCGAGAASASEAVSALHVRSLPAHHDQPPSASRHCERR